MRLKFKAFMGLLKAFLKNVGFGISMLLIALAIGVAAITLPVFGNNALIVRSGSMQPTIKVGDLVAVQSQQGFVAPQDLAIPNYRIGDIIAFKNQQNSKIITTHRIVGTEIKDGKVFYQTKGDANNAADQALIPQENVIGNAQYSVTSIGRIFAFARSKIGLGLMVIFPALTVIIIELVNIISEIKKRKKLAFNFKPTNNQSGNSVGILRVLLPLLVSVFVVRSSFAYFSDTANSTGNIFSAAQAFSTPTPSPSPTPPPIANHLVINEIYYDPDANHMQGNSPDENNFEWIELYNPTTLIVNLKDWKIVDNSGTERSISTSNRDLGPNSYVVMAKASNVRAIWGFSNDNFIAIGEIFGNGLANTGDRAILKNNLGNIIDQMSYGSDTTILDPSVPDVAEGHSLERNPAGVDTDTASDFVDRTTPTPGS